MCGLLGLGAAAFAWSSPAHPLAWSAALWPEQPWTLWTAAWVHQSTGQLAGNLLALLALAVVGAALRVDKASAAALFWAWPLATLGLLLWPGVSGYGGLGGPIHAAAMVLWAHLSLRPAWKPVSFVLFAAVALKLLAERAWAQPIVFDASWGTNVVYAAHLTGAATGAVCGLAAEGAQRLAAALSLRSQA